MDANVNFSVAAGIAERIGITDIRYRTQEGRFIVTDKDLARLRLTADEYVNGLDALLLTKEEAEALIAANGFQMGKAEEEEGVKVVETDAETSDEEVEEQKNEE